MWKTLKKKFSPVIVSVEIFLVSFYCIINVFLLGIQGEPEETGWTLQGPFRFCRGHFIMWLFPTAIQDMCRNMPKTSASKSRHLDSKIPVKQSLCLPYNPPNPEKTM